MDGLDRVNFRKSTVVPTTFQGLRVLLVDDDTSSLLRVSSVLEEHACKVTTTEIATIALAMLRENAHLFDLVMAHIDLPEMDIIQFLKSIKLIKDMPSVLMSSRPIEKGLLDKAMEQGACFVLEKPISHEKIKNAWPHICRTGTTEKMRAETELTDSRENTGYRFDFLNRQEYFNIWIESVRNAPLEGIKIYDDNVDRRRTHIRWDLPYSTADLQEKFIHGLAPKELDTSNANETRNVHFTQEQIHSCSKKPKVTQTFSTGYEETTFTQLPPAFELNSTSSTGGTAFTQLPPAGNNLLEAPQRTHQIQDIEGNNLMEAPQLNGATNEEIMYPSHPANSGGAEDTSHEEEPKWSIERIAEWLEV